jgi:hypothetical protein
MADSSANTEKLPRQKSVGTCGRVGPSPIESNSSDIGAQNPLWGIDSMTGAVFYHVAAR